MSQRDLLKDISQQTGLLLTQKHAASALGNEESTKLSTVSFSLLFSSLLCILKLYLFYQYNFLNIKTA